MGNDVRALGKALSCDLKDQLEEDKPEKETKQRVQRSRETRGVWWPAALDAVCTLSQLTLEMSFSPWRSLMTLTSTILMSNANGTILK